MKRYGVEYIYILVDSDKSFTNIFQIQVLLKLNSIYDFFSSEIAGLFQHPIHYLRFQQNQKLSQKKQLLQEHTMMTMYLKSHLIIP